MSDGEEIIKRRMTTDTEVIELIKKYFMERDPSLFQFGGYNSNAIYRLRLFSEKGERVDIELYGPEMK